MACPTVRRPTNPGRAIFAALGPGKTAVASVTVDGETVKSQPFQVPARGGLRVILAVGLDGAAAGSAATPGGTSAAPQAPAVPATPGTVVLGTQWRTIVDFADEKLEVFHIFEFVNAAAGPVSVPEPLKIAMPADAEQVTLLEGSTPQARVFERQLVVAGPFASGPHRRTGRLSLTHHGRAARDRAHPAGREHGDQRDRASPRRDPSRRTGAAAITRGRRGRQEVLHRHRARASRPARR